MNHRLAFRVVLSLAIGHCAWWSTRAQNTVSKVVCYEDQQCPHAYKSGKLVEIVQQPDVTLLVSMQVHYGMMEVEVGVANTSTSYIDVIPSEIFGESLQEDKKHPVHTTNLDQITREQLLGHSYSSASIMPSFHENQQTSANGQVVVVGPQSQSVYTYTATGESTQPRSVISVPQTVTGITPLAFAAADALAANTLAPKQMMHGMVYFALPPKHTTDAGVQIALAGKWYEFHFAWPRP